MPDETPASPEETVFALRYLHHYLFPDRERDSITTGEFGEALKTFQSIFSLEPTGRLDQRCIRSMLIPRCGLPDVQAVRTEEAKWRKRLLKIFVAKYVSGIQNSVQEDIFLTAFRSWSAVANITFDMTRVETDADIVISTGRGRRSGFDGAGNTLAWAELPPGDDRPLSMSFDLDETWVQTLGQGAREILLENVTCHEGGHTIGLDHSRNSRALMAPYYSPAIAKPQATDDIPRAQSLYGPPAPVTPPTPPVPPATRKITLEFSGTISKLEVPGWNSTRIGP